VNSPFGPSRGVAEAARAHEERPDDYKPVFEGQRRAELDEILKRYPTKMAALLPALWIVQEERGWISDNAMAEVAQVLDLTPAYVKGVVTFYYMYHQHPVGKYFIQVCTTSPCAIAGADEVAKALLHHTMCGELGETSADGKYTVIEVECLGACDMAPMASIDGRYVGPLSPDDAHELVVALREGRTPFPGRGLGDRE
jgi:NADH-quinone oxidoreductase E subunit